MESRAAGQAGGLRPAKAGSALDRAPLRGFKDFSQYVSTTRVIAGRDLLESTGFEFLKEGAGRVFIVTDRIIRATGLVDKVEAGVAGGGLEVAGVFDDVPQDSSTAVCEGCAAAAKEAGADSFLAVGGGSVMDTAKVADAVFTHGGSAREQEGFLLMPREADGMGRPLDIAPLACIPTTAGTGSEVSMAAVIKDHENKVKLEIADFPLFPRLAILDPETTRTLPASVAAATGMDAMTHAIEGYVSADWSAHGDARSLHALRMIRDNLERAVEGGEGDEEARGNMLLAANLAITISLGSVHAMSHPAGAHFGVPHGVANAIHLPHVIRHNAAGGADIAERYRDIGDLFDIHEPEIGEALAEHITGLVRRLGLPTRLSEAGVPESGLPALVEGAMGDGTTLLNPREMGEEDYAELYRRAL
ncbi:MAG TPA: iron-containing alcohol dehydrogenase [Thermoleophilaceae bacterium]|nr:iron-containing alcohol dehydrogenase [Actinomycetota bacterium]HYN51698.1 iron-containing alcohol dehydrogenase [Thermoleophilaceae bacterium]